LITAAHCSSHPFDLRFNVLLDDLARLLRIKDTTCQQRSDAFGYLIIF